MFDLFRENMMYFASLKENLNKDGTVNWNFIDADMYDKWTLLLDAKTYVEWFDLVADEMELADAV